MLPVRYELNFYILFVFRLVLTINSECFPKQHQPVWLCSGEVATDI
jgi:hypothetical protein